jgi:hypothetical protein
VGKRSRAREVYRSRAGGIGDIVSRAQRESLVGLPNGQTGIEITVYDERASSSFLPRLSWPIAHTAEHVAALAYRVSVLICTQTPLLGVGRGA